MSFLTRRPSVEARRGMVATSETQAAMAGLRVLQDGGNAVDAAVATSAALCVTEPMSTGLGGDMFALTWSAKDRKVTALNGSGRSGRRASLEELVKEGYREMPHLGAHSVTVPGIVDGWQTLLKRHGSMPLSKLLKPAISYAADGFVVQKVLGKSWAYNADKLARYPSGSEMLLNGRAPRAGEIMRFPELAEVLKSIARRGPKAFYKGKLAEKIANYVQKMGGWLEKEDLERHQSTWDEPISSDYRGVRVWECPPNGHGLAALMAMNIAEGFDIRGMGFQSADTYHHLIESMRLAYADALRYIGDPAKVDVPLKVLLDKGYAAERRGQIACDGVIQHPRPGNVYATANTAYLTVVDGDGNACSFINSLYESFGTGLVVPGTGIALHNRGALFSLDPEHPNALAPDKRPYHTIIPGMATRGDQMWLSFGVMGGFQQPQGQLQVMANMVDFDLEPQEALDALRFSALIGDGVAVEEEVNGGTREELIRRGHHIVTYGDENRSLFGGGQIIERDAETGCAEGWVGASEGWVCYRVVGGSSWSLRRAQHERVRSQPGWE